ncbi:hypothetical protein CO157_03655 [Candidatus Peregrinibacteria bacterium CG_4_9_14_3_um_filter_49_12]|nr:MAG: hypothetical protein COV83_02155 [Candidatus Peregrinibacteria bacterium CG11_big_fil_rev_8_21_14_0_20_49_14]PJA67499.1 MAG: hypothetical protein CO157_03655 [Candidatus Peregrinibacteria bacterium CG_4_9_14_3_um_filter_49_12]
MISLNRAKEYITLHWKMIGLLQRIQIILSLVLFLILLPFVYSNFSASNIEKIFSTFVFAIAFTFICTWYYPYFKSRKHGAMFNIIVILLLPLWFVFITSTLPNVLRIYLLKKIIGFLLSVSAVTFILTYLLKPNTDTKPKYKALLLMPVLILITEIVGNTSYHLAVGKFLWEPLGEFYNIRPYTERVGDARIFTSKKNYSDESYSFDENGFREGKNHYSSEGKNIVIIGDSVPFGMGVKNDETISSYLSVKLPSFGIINAALPSYSLHQAIARFKTEILGKFSTDILVLQIYDPASQFAIWGREWSPEISWASGDRKYNEKHDWIRNNQILKYSFIFYFLFPRDDQRVHDNLKLDKNDAIAFARFEDINLTELENLRKITDAKIIILPINNSPSARNNYPTEHLLAVETLNNILKKFSDKHDDQYFLDIREYFNSLKKDNLFLDSCCHLTPEGNKAQADALYEEIVMLQN